jgi:hypothetical protein
MSDGERSPLTKASMAAVHGALLRREGLYSSP